eukprot:scaffold239_cov62-Cyclotella_meneghiniana.AAC.3
MGSEPTRSGSFALDTKAQQSLDSLSTALDSQPPLPPSQKLGLGVGCWQSLLRDQLHKHSTMKNGGGLARYSPDHSLLNNMLDS